MTSVMTDKNALGLRIVHALSAYAAPVFQTPKMVVAHSIERGSLIPTRVPGPAPFAFNSRAMRVDSDSS